jgi:hypothetical protein
MLTGRGDRQSAADSGYRPSSLLVLGAAASAYIVFIARTAFLVDGTWHFTLLDDAMVSMRYARNMADGHGLVWNAGETPVEGYTNLLWTLWMSVVHAVGISPAWTSLVVAASSIPLLIAVAWIAGRIAGRLAEDSSGRPAVMALALVSLYYPLIFWALRGSEIGAVTLAVTASTLFALRLIERMKLADLVQFAIAGMAAILLRLDSIVPVVILGGAVTVLRPASERLRLAIGLLLVVGVPIVAHGLFSAIYYSSVLPNTYYLKMTGVSLWTRVSRGSLMFALAVLRHFGPMLILAAAACRTGARSVRERRIVLAVFAGQALYSVYAGGDAWESYGFANRYLTVAAPGLLVLAALEIEAIARGVKESGQPLVAVVRVLAVFSAVKLTIEWAIVAANRDVDYDLLFLYRDHKAVAVVGILTGLVLIAIVFQASRPLIARLRASASNPAPRVAFGLAAAVWMLTNGQNTALWLRFDAPEARYDNHIARAGMLIKASTTDDAVIAAARVGALTYFAERRSLDLLGKSDPKIAHLKPVSVFKPGHDRWDYPMSVGAGHPDVIGDLWLPTERDFQFLAAAGYRKLANGLYVQQQSAKIDFARLDDSRH